MRALGNRALGEHVEKRLNVIRQDSGHETDLQCNLRHLRAAVFLADGNSPVEHVRHDSKLVHDLCVLLCLEGLDVQRREDGRVNELEVDCILLAEGFAGLTAAAELFVDLNVVVGIPVNGEEVAVLFAHAAVDALVAVDLCNVAGTSHHRGGQVVLAQESGAAARAAVADAVQTASHGVLEKGRVDVAALMALVEDLERLFLRDQTAVDIAVAVHRPRDPWLADDEADVTGLAALVAAHVAANAVDDGNAVRALDDGVAGNLVGDDGLRQLAQIEILCEGDNLLRLFETHNLCVIGVGHNRTDIAIALVDSALDKLVNNLVFDAGRLNKIVRLRQVVVEGSSHVIDVKGDVAHIELSMHQLCETLIGTGKRLA